MKTLVTTGKIMQIQISKTLCSWILALSISLISFTVVVEGQPPGQLTRDLANQGDNSKSPPPQCSAVNKVTSNYTQLSGRPAQTPANPRCPPNETSCPPCQTVRIVCADKQPLEGNNQTNMTYQISSNKKQDDSQIDPDTAYVRYLPDGNCELHLSQRYLDLLGELNDMSKENCMQPANAFQSSAPKTTSEPDGLACGATVSVEIFKDIFALNLGALILQTRECLPDALCVLAAALGGGENSNETCNLSGAVRTLLQHYQSLGTLFDEIYHILQTGTQWCVEKKACLEAGSAKANLTALLALESLIADLANSSPKDRDELISHYCSQVFGVTIAVGVESCICKLENFSMSACISCVTSNKLVASLPVICVNLPADLKKKIEEEMRESYLEGDAYSHNCSAYHMNDCIDRFCKGAKRYDKSCIDKNWPQLEACANTPCNNHCPTSSNPNQCCTSKQGCYQGRCENKLGCINCTEKQSCQPTNAPPYYYACKDLWS